MIIQSDLKKIIIKSTKVNINSKTNHIDKVFYITKHQKIHSDISFW